MRFLCEQCKAKYQIADEKVAGKTVRMKCRKCGHLIEVKADVTETSVSTKAPQPDEDASDEATRIGMDVNSMMKLSPGAPTKAPGKPPAPRPAGGTKPGLATSLASAKPAKPTTLPTRSEGGALAGAFNKSVAKDEDRGMLEISTTSEWYCAINGVPVGPIRIAELRRKASSGAVHEESLVWQEGMEEWRPLRTIPELVAIVHEGLTSERPSLVTGAPGPPRPSSPPPQARSHQSTRPEPVRTPTPAPARSNVVSLSARLATAEKLEPEELPDPFASKSPISGIDPLSSPKEAPVAPALSAMAPTVVIPRKQGTNWVVIGMVVAFGAFGATAGVAVFFRAPPPLQPAPTVIVTQAAPPTAIGAGQPLAAGTDTVTIQPGADPTSTRPTGTARSGNVAAAGTGSAQRVVDPSIAALLGGPGGGPAIGGGGQGGSSSSALDAEAIQRVVQQRSAGVKRTCWERGGGTESNVNVRVHLAIAASGNVQTASAEGNDPIVSKCIENSVRGWVFPVSSGSTNVDIPFHFLRQ